MAHENSSRAIDISAVRTPAGHRQTAHKSRAQAYRSTANTRQAERGDGPGDSETSRDRPEIAIPRKSSCPESSVSSFLSTLHPESIAERRGLSPHLHRR